MEDPYSSAYEIAVNMEGTALAYPSITFTLIMKTNLEPKAFVEI